ncbi:MAG: hypothetical protein ACRDVG_09435 [Jatrophihabitantaceae bacterium]
MSDTGAPAAAAHSCRATVFKAGDTNALVEEPQLDKAAEDHAYNDHLGGSHLAAWSGVCGRVRARPAMINAALPLHFATTRP